MALLCVILIVNCLILAVRSDKATLDEDQRKAIQEKLDRLQVIEDFMRAIANPDAQTEAREEKCLPLGSVCSFTSGPRCCSIRTRCFIWDRLMDGGTPRAHWVSHCREYNGGVWVDEIGKFFKKLG